jgi:hypothetical protein
MIAALPSPLIDQWRQEVGGTRDCDATPRPLAALGYLAGGPVVEGLIAVERLILTVLYDEPLPRGGVAVRLAGFTGRRIPWGVRWGGPGQCRFFKDLRLQPVPGGPGLRVDLAHERLLRLGLQLAHQLDRRLRHPSPVIRDEIRLPCLWAGFPPEDAVEITGDGPELAEYVRRTGTSPQRLLARICREHSGPILYPFPWVSHCWRQALSVFADWRLTT